MSDIYLKFIRKIKKSQWNKSFIKSPKLDKFLNGVFWGILIMGSIVVIGLFILYLFYILVFVP